MSEVMSRILKQTLDRTGYIYKIENGREFGCGYFIACIDFPRDRILSTWSLIYRIFHCAQFHSILIHVRQELF